MELSKVNSVASPSNFRFPLGKKERRRHVVKQREGERQRRGEGKIEREREEGERDAIWARRPRQGKGRTD